MFKYDILCIGSATLDNFLTIEQKFDSIHPGDKVLVKNMESIPAAEVRTRLLLCPSWD